MGIKFEWDAAKARLNLTKHSVSFEEASTVFGDRSAITIPDPVHSLAEERFVTIGVSDQGKILVVVATERDDSLRLISARSASRRERKQYEEAD
jgi:uncharacterized protein